MVATPRDAESASALAARLVMMLASQRVIGGRHITATASMGIAPAGCAASIDEALKCVDIALYRAKLDGRNRFVMYTDAIRNEHEDGVALETELRDAIRRGEFELHFQPIYNPRSGTATMAEALLRWRPRRAWSAPRSSSRWPNGPASSPCSAPGCSARRSGRPCPGRAASASASMSRPASSTMAMTSSVSSRRCSG
jgi:predicted signal transduction protein with EAL and GGDEF domain